MDGCMGLAREGGRERARKGGRKEGRNEGGDGGSGGVRRISSGSRTSRIRRRQ